MFVLVAGRDLQGELDPKVTREEKEEKDPREAWDHREEAENKELTDEVLRLMPEFFNKPNCLGVGETGLHKSTPNEIESLQAHVDMAMKHGQLVLIHTPHLADKAHGTKTVLEVLAGMDVDPDRIWIDHVEEQTI